MHFNIIPGKWISHDKPKVNEQQKKLENLHLELLENTSKIIAMQHLSEVKVSEDGVRDLFLNYNGAFSEEGKARIRVIVAGNKELQNILSPDLKRLRAEKRDDATKVLDPEHKLNRKIAKMKLATKLGQKMEYLGKGCSGTRFIKGVNGKKLAIYKVSHADLKWTTRIINFFKYISLGQLGFLNPDKKSNYLCEVLAYRAQELGFSALNIAPVRELQIGKENGAFMLFKKGHQELREVQEEFNSRGNYTDEEVNLVQQFFIYDYLIGNLDRHNENSLWKMKEGKVSSIVPIDNEHSFPVRLTHPLAYFAERNQYCWRHLEISDIPFTEESKAFITNNLTVDKIDAWVAKMESIALDSKDKPLLRGDMRKFFYSRVAQLRDCAQGNGAKTPRELTHQRRKLHESVS